MKDTITNAGIEYSKPTVILLQESGLGTAELAARTCYDSFEASESECISSLNTELFKGYNEATIAGLKAATNSLQHSDLLDTLAWTHFHHSILEHCNLTYLIRGTSRGVLQEHARHRIQAISVQSTRYTMSGIINAYSASQRNLYWFTNKVLEFDMFVTTDEEYNRMQIGDIFNKLKYQEDILGRTEFRKISVAKSSLEYLNNDNADIIFEALQSGKKKRNVGDAFKHIVTDNWKVDLVVTFNLRSLKNYLSLRDSGAAYFLIRELAIAMKTATPPKYLDLIVKPSKHE